MSEQNKDAERARVVDAMCMTWRHDFGLERKEDELGSCGMTETERDALRRQMGQLYDHHLAARSLPVGVPDELTEVERKAIVGLIELASHAFHVADNGEDAGEKLSRCRVAIWMIWGMLWTASTSYRTTCLATRSGRAVEPSGRCVGSSAEQRLPGKKVSPQPSRLSRCQQIALF
ncbi:hypothetical protein OMD46_16710 [Pseudomonas sp. MDMC_285]|nr:hypothetical protein [Pseudomonas sp. MDMC_285]